MSKSPRKQRSPQKKTAIAFQSVLDNYELEVATRRHGLEQAIQDLVASLRRRCEAELARLPLPIQNMTVAEFMDAHKGDFRAAMEATVKRQIDQATLHASQSKPPPPPPSPKKRKRPDNPSVPPSPAVPQAKRHAGGFLASSSSSVPASASAASTTPPPQRITSNGRRPKPEETVRAYSLNGSPLGVIKHDEWAGKVPTGEFTFQLTLASLSKGLEDELSKLSLPAQERAQLQNRLLKLVQDLAQPTHPPP